MEGVGCGVAHMVSRVFGRSAVEQLPQHVVHWLTVRLLGRLAMELHFSSEPERCQAVAQQSVALARRLSDPSTLAFALNARHWAQRGQDDIVELLAIAEEIISCAEPSAELELALQGHSWRLVDLLELGQTEQVDDEIAACATLAERLGQLERTMGRREHTPRGLQRLWAQFTTAGGRS